MKGHVVEDPASVTQHWRRYVRHQNVVGARPANSCSTSPQWKAIKEGNSEPDER